MTVEERRRRLDAMIAAKRDERYEEYFAALPRVPGLRCPRCGAEVVSQCITMREPPGFRSCANRCGWFEDIDGQMPPL